MNDRIMGLTLHRPWGWAILHMGKDIENRSWCPPENMIGRYMALHHGKTYDEEGAIWLDKLSTSLGLGLRIPDHHEAGVIIGVAKLVAVLHTMRSVGPRHGRVVLGDETTYHNKDKSPFWFGPYGWVLDEVIPITPVPCRGAQKLWSLPPDVLEQVRDRYRYSIQQRQLVEAGANV